MTDQTEPAELVEAVARRISDPLEDHADWMDEARVIIDTVRSYDAERGGWQPIDTAPKDGSYIHVYDAASARDFGDPKAGICAAVWVDADEEEIAEGVEPQWQVQPYVEGLDCTYDFELTHWMPLPAAPALLSTAGEGE